MPFTNDQLAALDDAIASGELTVSSKGRTVTYRSMDDLLKARELVARELAKAASAGRPAAPTIGGLGYAVASFPDPLA